MRFTFRRYFSNQNGAWFDISADANDSAFIKITQGSFTNVGNIAGDFFRSQLGVAGFDFQLFDVNRSVIIVLDHLFRDQNRVLEVVTAPGHKCDQHVTTQSEFAAFSTRPVSNDFAFHDAITFAHNRLLIDAGILVRAFEFDERINVRRHFA